MSQYMPIPYWSNFGFPTSPINSNTISNSNSGSDSPLKLSIAVQINSLFKDNKITKEQRDSLQRILRNVKDPKQSELIFIFKTFNMQKDIDLFVSDCIDLLMNK